MSRKHGKGNQAPYSPAGHSLSTGPYAPSELAIIYSSEFDYISRCILDYPDIETGGQLFGFWTAEGVPVVLYAIGPGRYANHQATFFNQDIDYLKTVGQAIIDRFGLQHIGEWHSHHHLGLDHPSGHDASTMATSIEHLDLHRFLLCIGTCAGGRSTINPYNFHESDLYNYSYARWRVLSIDSPFRAIIDSSLADILVHPYTRTASHGAERIEDGTPEQIRPMYKQHYWLRDKANNLQLKKIVDFLAASTGSVPSVRMDESGRVSVYADTATGVQVEVFFPDGFPSEAPEITLPESYRVQAAQVPVGEAFMPMARDFWEYDGDIAESFRLCYERLRGVLPPPLDIPEAEPETEQPAAEEPAIEEPTEPTEQPADEPDEKNSQPSV